MTIRGRQSDFLCELAAFAFQCPQFAASPLARNIFSYTWKAVSFAVGSWCQGLVNSLRINALRHQQDGTGVAHLVGSLENSHWCWEGELIS